MYYTNSTRHVGRVSDFYVHPDIKSAKIILGGNKKRKVRKHRGIIQLGGNAGKLRKGFKYSGKRTKKGLAEIIKVNSNKN